ncbi:MAG: glycerol-3-phosphate transporter permease, partial [Kiloniellaceae bacterium]
MQHKRVIFQGRVLPYFLILPQLVVTLIFFIWPASQALYQSVLLEDPFGLDSTFVWFENFEELFADSAYLNSFKTTVVFSLGVTATSMIVALLLAAMADRVVRGATAYKTLLIWPYAVAAGGGGGGWVLLVDTALGG